MRGEGRGADGRTDVVFGKEVGMHCDGGRWSGGFSEEGKKVACDTGRVVVVVVVELGPELFPRQVLRLPRISRPFKGWLLTSRSASPDVPRSSGHLRTALNQRFDSSVTRLLLPLDCPSSSRREPYIDIPLTHHFDFQGSLNSVVARHVGSSSARKEAARFANPSSTPRQVPSLLTFSPPAWADLQLQYSTYKNTLQQIAQKIGDVEQEAEEHK